MKQRSCFWKPEESKQFNDEVCILHALEFLLSEKNSKMSVFSGEERIILLKELLSHGQKNVEHIYNRLGITKDELLLNIKLDSPLSFDCEVHSIRVIFKADSKMIIENII